MLSDHGKRRAEALGDLRRGKTLLHMKAPRDGSRKQELAREEAHLDLPPLFTAVVHDPIESNRRSFGRTRGVNLA